MTMKILAFSGSLRRGSYNTMLLAAAAQIVPIEIFSIGDIPLYDGDVEAESGIPANVAAIKEQLIAADGLLIATPEYNYSMPGVAKNAIDWISRPGRDVPRVFGGLPVALIGATPGRGGTALAQTAWLSVLRALGTHPWFGRSLQVSNAESVFDELGKLRDDDIRARLEKFMRGFAAFVETNKRR